MQETCSSLNQALIDAEIISNRYDVTGSSILLPYGCKIRSIIVSTAKRYLECEGYEEICLPNLISGRSMERLDEIYKISDRYYKLSQNLYLAATHEASFYSFLEHNFNFDEISETLKYYSFNVAFRKPKKIGSPYKLGERSSFLEAYAITKDIAALEKNFNLDYSGTEKLLKSC